jgi:hypothetical protein
MHAPDGTRGAPRVSARRLAVPLSAGLALAGLVVLALAIGGWATSHPAGWGYDFRAYFEAALRLIATGSPYQSETLDGPFRPGPGGLYLYSPIPALLLVPITPLGLDAATLVWLGIRVAGLALACALMPVSRNIRVAAFGIVCLSEPVLHDISLGNVSLLVTLLAVLTWRWLDRRAGSAVCAVGLAFRPTLGLLWIWWLLRGQWRALAWSVGTGALIVGLSLPFVGLAGWLDYASVLRNATELIGIPQNVDLGSALLLAGGPESAAPLALWAGYIVSGTAVLLSLRRDRELSYVVTLMATLLLAPLLWDHYLTNLLVPAAFLAARGRPWGLALPLLGWLPQFLLPLVAVASMLLPFLAPDRGERAGSILIRRGLRSGGPTTTLEAPAQHQ